MTIGERKRYFELLWAMTGKELRSRYKYTVFGFLWLVANPALQMLVISFIFTFLVREPVPQYRLYLFQNLLVWNFFSLSLTKATPSIVWERNLIKKSGFPRSVIPISIITSNLVHLCTALALYAVPVCIFNRPSFADVMGGLGGLFLLAVFTAGISLLTSALNVRYRDVNFFVQAFLIVWFYATPILYSLTVVPNESRWLWLLNPLTAVFMLIQHAFLEAQEPSEGLLLANTATIAFVAAVGTAVFGREARNFDDWV